MLSEQISNDSSYQLLGLPAAAPDIVEWRQAVPHCALTEFLTPTESIRLINNCFMPVNMGRTSYAAIVIEPVLRYLVF